MANALYYTEVELVCRAGIEAARRWGVTDKTSVMFTHASKVEFCGLSYEKIIVEIETFTWSHYVLGMGYYKEADVLILSIPER